MNSTCLRGAPVRLSTQRGGDRAQAARGEHGPEGGGVAAEVVADDVRQQHLVGAVGDEQEQGGAGEGGPQPGVRAHVARCPRAGRPRTSRSPRAAAAAATMNETARAETRNVAALTMRAVPTPNDRDQQRRPAPGRRSAGRAAPPAPSARWPGAARRAAPRRARSPRRRAGTAPRPRRRPPPAPPRATARSSPASASSPMAPIAAEADAVGQRSAGGAARSGRSAPPPAAGRPPSAASRRGPRAPARWARSRCRRRARRARRGRSRRPAATPTARSRAGESHGCGGRAAPSQATQPISKEFLGLVRLSKSSTSVSVPR